jgi:hypothetical protein
MNNGLKRTCMEAIVAQLRYYSGVYIKCLGKTKKICHDRRSSGLYFTSGLSDYEARRSDKASYRIQTITDIAEEDKSIANTWKTLL